MWIKLLMICCSFVTCFGKPAESDGSILDYTNNVDPDGNYNFRYRTDDGSVREESGKIENNGKEGILKVQGFYEYLGSDGNIYKIMYGADENGYRAKAYSDTSSPPPRKSLEVDYYTTPIPSAALASLAGGGLG